VVGYSRTTAGFVSVFLWQDRTMIDLGALSGDPPARPATSTLEGRWLAAAPTRRDVSMRCLGRRPQRSAGVQRPQWSLSNGSCGSRWHRAASPCFGHSCSESSVGSVMMQGRQSHLFAVRARAAVRFCLASSRERTCAARGSRSP